MYIKYDYIFSFLNEKKKKKIRKNLYIYMYVCMLILTAVTVIHDYLWTFELFLYKSWSCLWYKEDGEKHKLSSSVVRAIFQLWCLFKSECSCRRCMPCGRITSSSDSLFQFLSDWCNPCLVISTLFATLLLMCRSTLNGMLIEFDLALSCVLFQWLLSQVTGTALLPIIHMHPLPQLSLWKGWRVRQD